MSRWPLSLIRCRYRSPDWTRRVISNATGSSGKTAFRRTGDLLVSFPIRRESQSSLLGQFRPMFPLCLPDGLERRVNAHSFSDRIAQFEAISPKGMPNPYENRFGLCPGLCSRISDLPLVSFAPSVQSTDHAVFHGVVLSENHRGDKRQRSDSIP
jgi:hypothetical protein